MNNNELQWNCSVSFYPTYAVSGDKQVVITKAVLDISSTWPQIKSFLSLGNQFGLESDLYLRTFLLFQIQKLRTICSKLYLLFYKTKTHCQYLSNKPVNVE